MTLQWADFPSGEQGLYGTQGDRMLDGTPWVFVASFPISTAIAADPDPLIGANGRVLRHRALSGSTVATRLALTSPDDVVGVAHNFYASSLPLTATPFLAFLTTGNVLRYQVRVRPNGGLEITRNTTVVATADFPIILANSWNLIETLVDITAGTVEVRKNDLTVLSYTDPTPFTGTIGLVSFPDANLGESNSFFSKNIVVYNGQGSSFNTFQGNVIVTDLRPDEDVTLGGWTPSTGTEAWPLLDESPPDDADYIEAGHSPLPSPAEVEFTSLPPDVTSIRGLISITRSRKTDGGDGNLQTSLSPDGTNYDVGTDNPVTTTPTYRYDVSQVSPATTAAWSPTEVNSIRQRYDRTV
jgi:hypothetical protein